MDIAVSVGLPREESEAVLVKRTFKEEVDEDWALSHKNSVTAVPTFVMNKDRLVGAKSYEMLEGLMGANGVKTRNGAQIVRLKTWTQISVQMHVCKPDPEAFKSFSGTLTP